MPDLDMSPYGAFVWGAYAVSGLALAGLALAILRRARAATRRLAELEGQS